MNENKYKCFFCAEGETPRNIIDQLEVLSQASGVPKTDLIQLALIDEIRKIRILLEGQGYQESIKKINTARAK